ncbi:MAG: phosphatidylserine decarboxylase [Clostridiales bacterium]|nr:phosphatidylserine decarboxylase [Clostridiales bacterium]
MIKVYQRDRHEYKETVQYGSRKLEFMYNNAFGRILLRLAISRLPSVIYGKIKSSRRSAKKVPGFIEAHGIDMSQYEDREFTSFTDFFTRKFREGARPIGEGLISPADSKLLVYPADEDTRINVKGREYFLNEITNRDMSGYKGGSVLVFRLCIDDGHRYCFPAAGKVMEQYDIKGKLHTVSPLSSAYKIYKENTRKVSFLETEEFGKICCIEVGAILVGKIVDHGKKTFAKGEEKGYFEPGGSTIIVIVPKGIKIDDDIMEESAKGIETEVKYGERIGDIC